MCAHFYQYTFLRKHIFVGCEYNNKHPHLTYLRPRLSHAAYPYKTPYLMINWGQFCSQHWRVIGNLRTSNKYRWKRNWAHLTTQKQSVTAAAVAKNCEDHNDATRHDGLARMQLRWTSFARIALIVKSHPQPYRNAWTYATSSVAIVPRVKYKIKKTLLKRQPNLPTKISIVKNTKSTI